MSLMDFAMKKTLSLIRLFFIEKVLLSAPEASATVIQTSTDDCNGSQISILAGHRRFLPTTNFLSMESAHADIISLKKDPVTGRVYLYGSTPGKTWITALPIDGRPAQRWSACVYSSIHKVRNSTAKLKYHFNYTPSRPRRLPGWH